VYSFLKRDVVRRTEEQSSLPAITSLPAQPPFCSLYSFDFRFGCFLAAGRGEAKQKGVCSEAAEKLRVRVCPCGLDCASLSVYVCVGSVWNESSLFPILWWIREAPLFFVSLRAPAGLVGNLLQSGLDPVVPSSFYRFPDVPTRGSPATASGGCGYFPPPSAGRGEVPCSVAP